MGNKGFSLIELIIVIAIMAVLLGLVGTQVIPYLERSREAKDLQIVNSYCTAAVTAYTSHAETLGSGDIILKVYKTGETLDENQTLVLNEIYELTGYKTLGDMTSGMTSKKKSDINYILIEIKPTEGTITAQAYKSDGTTKVFDEVKSQIGKY